MRSRGNAEGIAGDLARPSVTKASVKLQCHLVVGLESAGTGPMTLGPTKGLATWGTSLGKG